MVLNISLTEIGKSSHYKIHTKEPDIFLMCVPSFKSIRDYQGCENHVQDSVT